MELQFDQPPPLWRSYLRALLLRRSRGAGWPQLAARVSGLRPQTAQLQAYRQVCGFPEQGALPPTFLHVLATPLHLALLTSAAFPLPVIGLIHVRNALQQYTPLAEESRFDLQCQLSELRESERGQEFDLLSSAQQEGQLVWSETSTYLARRQAGRRAPGNHTGHQHSDEWQLSAQWKVAANIGRRYAAVSGDINPIHLSKQTARLFGFRHAIAHGMWSIARCLAALEPDQSDAPLSLEVRFRAPLSLPGQVTLLSRKTGATREFMLEDTQSHRQYLHGNLRMS